MKWLCAFVLAALPFAAGCSGSSSPSLPCPAVTGVLGQGALVSPANGATGVPTNVGSVSFTVTPSTLQGSGATVTLNAAVNGQSTQLSGGSVSTVNGVSSAAIPPLQSGVTYSVSVSASPLLSGSTTCRGAVSANLRRVYDVIATRIALKSYVTA